MVAFTGESGYISAAYGLVHSGEIHLDMHSLKNFGANFDFCYDLTIEEAEKVCLALFNELESIRLEKENG